MKIIDVIFCFCITISVIRSITLNKGSTFLSGDSCEPVIGILASPSPNNPDSGSSEEVHGTEKFAQVDLNYIQWLQLGGAKVIVIMPWWSESYLNTILSNIGGVLFQGGLMKFNKKRDYTRTQISILEYAKANPNFVVWGICNGFQAINHWAYDHTNKNNPIYENSPKMETLLIPAKFHHSDKSRMLSHLSEYQRYNLKQHKTTAHFHSYSVSLDKVKNSKEYNNLLKVVSFAVNPSNSSDIFVNAIEGINNKIYGTQFHPEKMLNTLYRKNSTNPEGILDDGKDGIHFNQGTIISKALAKFLVKEASSRECTRLGILGSLRPLPFIEPILKKEVHKIQSGQKLNQLNLRGIAIKSCGIFSYSWYSKSNPDPTSINFACPVNSEQSISFKTTVLSPMHQKK